MLINKRRRVVGFLVAVAVPAMVGAIAMPANGLSANDPIIRQTCTDAPHNLVMNCGFESAVSGGVVPNWTHIASHDGFVSTTQAHSGAHSLAFGSTGDDDVYIQTVKVAPHTKYLIGASVDALSSGGSANNDFTLAATNINGSSDATTIYTASNLTPNWFQVGQIVTTTGASTITLVLRGANVPDHTYVDDVFVSAQPAGCAAIANDLVGNCGFEASSASPWINSGTNHDSQITTGSSYGGIQSLRFASTGADDAWFQVLTVRPHTQYKLTYWTEYWSGSSSPNNDLSVIVSNVPAASGGSLKVSTAGVANKFWSSVTRTFTTGSGTSATLLITGANDPASTYVDDVSVTAVPHVHVSAKGRTITTTLTGLGGQKVHLEKLVNKHWVIVHTWTAPKTGWSKSWAFTVSSGGSYRSVAASAPGYSSATSNTISVK